MNKYLRFLACLALTPILMACSDAVTETQRASNPSGTIDAVVADRKAVAMPVKPTEIYVLPKGARISGEPAVKVDNARGVRVSWRSDGQLTIHAEKARVLTSEPGVEVRVPNSQRPKLIRIGLDIPGVKQAPDNPSMSNAL